MREALADVKRELPFEICAAVILPDHLHFIWTLPSGDANYSKRIGLMKANFTKASRHDGASFARQAADSPSRRKHRESNLWQRRFWEHTIDDEDEFDAYFDYIHYNPVKHGHVRCPHAWAASSFHRSVERGIYDVGWGCQCGDRKPKKFNFSAIESCAGEP